MKKILIAILILSFNGNNAFAFGLKSFDKLNLQIGTWMENYQQVQGTQDGDKNGFQFAPYIGVGLEYKLKPQYLLTPEIGYIIQRTSDEIKKNQFFLRADFAYLPNDWLRLKVGSSLMILMISGDGGEDTLPNGNSTETYYIPEERRTAYNQTLDFGLEVFNDNMSARFQSFIYAWNESEERLISYALSYNYFIPIKDFL
ncbi:MAG: hypothetical protein ACJAS4_000968 [Bacteriovoracaceae bacterium]|jgi:hypothetical protein